MAERKPAGAAAEIAAAWKDLALGVALIAGGLYAAWRINFVDRPGFVMSTGPLDYAGVPTIASLGIAALALVYAAGAFARLVALRGFDPARWGRPSPIPSRTAVRRVGTVVLLVAYALALKAVPFFAATAVFLAAMFVLYGHLSPLRIGVVALAGSAGLTALFVHALKLPL